MGMNLGFSVGDFIAIKELCVKIQDVHDTLAASYERDDSQRVTMALESGKQKLELWKKTWLSDDSNPIARSEVLWGKDGWIDIQKLLTEIATTLKQFQPVEKDNQKYQRPLWIRFFLGQPKKQTSGLSGLPSVLALALELDKSIDELWMYSEIAFDSLHGVLAQNLGPLVRDQQLFQSVPVRQGALALYRACGRSKARCELNVDLFRQRAIPMNPLSHPRPVSLEVEKSIFYHLRLSVVPKSTVIPIELAGAPNMRSTDVTIESFNYPNTVEGSPNIDVYAEPDLETLILESSLEPRIFCIGPEASGSGSYFRVTKVSIAPSLASESSHLTQILFPAKATTNTKAKQSMSSVAKLDLAYKLVHCGFYLLGTPWLASLSSKRLRRVETLDNTTYALEIETIPLDNLYIENPDALSETSQLFRIGVLLIEIALGTRETSDPAEVEEPYLRASKLLPLVQAAVGTQYCKACAFCIQDRSSSTSYGRPDKYQYAEKTGWDMYLRDLIEDYHAQVLSR